MYLAFEIDRMRVVHAVDVPTELLARAPKDLQSLPLDGPGLVAVRPFASETEKAEATMAALQGLELGFRPDLWVSYGQTTSQVRAASVPLAALMDKYPAWRPALLAAVEQQGTPIETVRYLPMHARTAFWTVLLDGPSLVPFAYLPLDPYTP
ncbi:hypothetical protein FQZ97_1130940 [compost metagenome]